MRFPIFLLLASAAFAQDANEIIRRATDRDRIAELAMAAIDRYAPTCDAAMLLVVRGETVALPLAGVVDLNAEKARLDREIAKEKLEIAKVLSKLGNDDFVARAPEDVIAEHQDRLETFQARLVKLTGARERLERI